MPSSESKQYLDLHVTGIGDLNRVRSIQPRNGEAFLACVLNALHGDTAAVEYTPFDCRVYGEEAQDLVAFLKPQVDARRKVRVAFRLGDIYLHQFVYDQGERKGQPGALIKGRLLKLYSAKIDGEPIDLPRREPSVTPLRTGTDD